MAAPDRAVIERKLGSLNRYVRDLSQHALLDDACFESLPEDALQGWE